VSGAQFLPGIPVSHVVTRLAKAGGKEIESGKLLSSESSAALAVNCFGWFIERPELLPPLIGLETAGVPELVDVEFCARFPWSGGRHPWLDAAQRLLDCPRGADWGFSQTALRLRGLLERSALAR
jgi:hypothetical protein